MPATTTIRVLEGDARRLDGIDAGSVDLVVTSPPYPMIPMWDRLFHELGADDFEAMHRVLDDAWSACRRVLVDGGLMAVNVGDAVRSGPDGFRLWPNHVRVSVGAERAGFRPLPYLLWKKPTNKPNAFLGSGFLPPNAYVTLDCEFVLLFRNGGLRAFPPHDPRRSASRYTRAERDRWFSQVWEGIRGAPQGAADRRSAAFPAEIPERLVRMFSRVGDVVLDPFAGSGTTLWAARRLGRSAIGVERDPERAALLRATAASPPSAPAAPRPRASGRGARSAGPTAQR